VLEALLVDLAQIGEPHDHTDWIIELWTEFSNRFTQPRVTAWEWDYP
jgi:hypothetical protein